ARELGVPVIAAAQLNRSTESQERPMLSNLRESGTIESDADVVILLHQAQEAEHPSDPREIETIVAKNRNGPVGTAKLLFQPNLVRFVDIEPAFATSPPVVSYSETKELPGLDKGGEYHE